MDRAEALEIARRTWQYRAIAASMGNQSKLGALLLAVIGKPGKNPPWFGPSGVIDPAGNILANFVDRQNRMHEAVFVGSVRDVNDNFNRLADTIQATDQERIEMFAELRKWIAKDFRDQRVMADRLQ